MLRNAEKETQDLADELEKLADATDLDRVERVRRHYESSKRYYAALQSAIPGVQAGSSATNSKG